MSTDLPARDLPAGQGGRGDMLDERWDLSPAVALRPEPFGALAYHFGNRRLTFLKRPDLVRVVRALDTCPDVRTALIRSEVPPAQWPAYLGALAGLATTEMIRRHPAEEAGE